MNLSWDSCDSRLISDYERRIGASDRFSTFPFQDIFSPYLSMLWICPMLTMCLDRRHDHFSRDGRLCQFGPDGRVHVFHLDHPCAIGLFTWRFRISWCEWEHDDRSRGECFSVLPSIFIVYRFMVIFVTAYSLSFMSWLPV